MASRYEDMLKAIQVNRIVDDLWDLVNVPSPTRSERDAVLLFSKKLEEIGVRVELDETYPNSPSVVGWLEGNRAGATFQLAGHLDHIDKPHPAPAKDGETVSGRGVSDMKNGMAGILEILRVLADGGCDFPGRVLVTAYGLHEAPLGFGEGLRALLEKGIKGDAALVAEGASDAAVVAGCGMAIWRVLLSRAGEVRHELKRPPEADELLRSALSLADLIEQQRRSLSTAPHDYAMLGSETVFIGQLHYGDFYNRVLRECFLEGTRRWHPGRSLKDVQAELSELVQTVCVSSAAAPDAVASSAAAMPAVTAQATWQLVGESFEMDKNERVVKALQSAYATVYEESLPVRGIRSITDGARLVSWGNVPTVLWGFDGRTAHADFESVSVRQLEKSCRVGLLTLLTYLYP